MTASVWRTSSIRLADTDARGHIIDIIQIIRNAITICMVYWIKAIISPTSIVPF